MLQDNSLHTAGALGALYEHAVLTVCSVLCISCISHSMIYTPSRVWFSQRMIRYMHTICVCFRRTVS